MKPITIAAGIGLALLLLPKKASAAVAKSDDDTQPGTTTQAMRALVRREAQAQGVPPIIALAFARVESNFDPRAEGDLKWHENTARYKRVVPVDSPYAGRPELWHSYGLFQLLAPYFVGPGEDPRMLLSPAENALRGVAYIAKLYKLHAGDVDQMRLAYTGATQADDATKAKILARWHAALDKERQIENRGAA